MQMMTFLAIRYWKLSLWLMKGNGARGGYDITDKENAQVLMGQPSSSINNQKHPFRNAFLLLRSQHCSWEPAINQQLDIFSKKILNIPYKLKLPKLRSFNLELSKQASAFKLQLLKVDLPEGQVCPKLCQMRSDPDCAHALQWYFNPLFLKTIRFLPNSCCKTN